MAGEILSQSANSFEKIFVVLIQESKKTICGTLPAMFDTDAVC